MVNDLDVACPATFIGLAGTNLVVKSHEILIEKLVWKIGKFNFENFLIYFLFFDVETSLRLAGGLEIGNSYCI